jgi:hypothetical protein
MYADYKHFRLFASKVPEGWQAAIYDRSTEKYSDVVGGWIFSSLEEAQNTAAFRLAAFLGEKIHPPLEWK